MANDSEDQGSLIMASQLRKARGVLELTPEEVAEELNVSVQDVGNWEKGDCKPSLKQLETLAELYGREIDYFLAETPNPPGKIKFRTAPGQGLRRLSRDARAILARFEELCRCAFELENLLGKKRRCEIPRFPPSTPPETAAGKVRRKLGVKNRPIPKLRDLLDGAGARIFELPVPNDEFSGSSYWHSDYGPCILLNASDPKGRRNFTLAHELAHLLYGHASSVCFVPISPWAPSPPVEQKANRFAVELLLPESAIAEDFANKGYSRRPKVEQLGRMRSKWGISLQALGYRLEKLGLVDRGYTDTLVEAKPLYARRSKTPKWERQLGKTFVETCLQAYSQNLVSIGKLAHSLRIPIRKAMEEVERRSQ